MENNYTDSNAGEAMGITSLVLGVLALIAAFIPCFGLVAILLGALAIIFGAIGMSQAKNGGGNILMPKVGFILGIVATGFVIIWFLLFVGTIGNALSKIKQNVETIPDSIEVEASKVNDSIEKDTVIVIDSLKADKDSK